MNPSDHTTASYGVEVCDLCNLDLNHAAKRYFYGQGGYRCVDCNKAKVEKEHEWEYTMGEYEHKLMEVGKLKRQSVSIFSMRSFEGRCTCTTTQGLT